LTQFEIDVPLWGEIKAWPSAPGFFAQALG